MALPKIIRAYQSLPLPKQQKFKQFLHSPYFNTREKLLVLGDYICHLVKNELDWNYEEASKLVFKSKPATIQPLNNLLSDLYKLLERFLRIEA
ncbi:MAG: hypothetical protein ACK4IY_02790, partial [Chitinophagales bacterium]